MVKELFINEVEIMPTENIKNTKKCVFCQYWFDPSFEAVEPVSPAVNMWGYKAGEKRVCTKKGISMNSDASCGNYKSRMSLYFN